MARGRILIIVVAMTLSLGAPAGAMAGPPTGAAVVARIDHISLNDADATTLFDLLTNVFRLPVRWPMSNYGSFSSGGVYLGNVVLEVGQLGAPPPQAGLSAVAFAPAVSAEASLSELDRRGLPHSALRPFPGPGGRLLWVTLNLEGLAPDGAFICDYHIPVAPGVEAARRALASDRGGPLGLIGVQELVLAVRDLPAAHARWRAVLAPGEAHEGRFTFAQGPAIRLVSGDTDAYRSLTLAVASLARARAFLTARSIAFDERDGALELARGLHGVSIRLVEGR